MHPDGCHRGPQSSSYWRQDSSVWLHCGAYLHRSLASRMWSIAPSCRETEDCWTWIPKTKQFLFPVSLGPSFWNGSCSTASTWLLLCDGIAQFLPLRSFIVNDPRASVSSAQNLTLLKLFLAYCHPNQQFVTWNVLLSSVGWVICMKKSNSIKYLELLYNLIF